MEFWFLALLICMASILPILFSWMKAGDQAQTDHVKDRSLFKARLAEIDADHELGRIDDLAREAAIAEESRRFLRLNNQEAADEIKSSGHRLTIILPIIFIAVPAFSVAIYMQTGSPQKAFEQTIETAEEKTPSLEELVGVAERRLETNPDDVRGWEVLAPVYVRLGEFDKAEEAFRNLRRLKPEDIGIKQALAEMLVVRNDNRVGEEALSMFREILADNPDHVQASFFIALAARQAGNTEEAERIWREMLSKAKGDENWVPAVQNQLAELPQKPETGLRLSEDDLERVNAMVEGLASRLEEEPGTKEDYERLVRSYAVLGKYDKAEEAFNMARQLFNDEEYLASLRKLISDGSSVRGN